MLWARREIVKAKVPGLPRRQHGPEFGWRTRNSEKRKERERTMGALPLKRPVGELYANERAEEGIRRREHIGRSVQNTARSDEGLAPTGQREEAGSGRKSSPWGGRPTLRVPRRAAG